MKIGLKNIRISFLVIPIIGILFAGCLDEGIDYEAREKKEREKFLETNDITVEPTASGLYFILTDSGYGEYAEIGDTITIDYEGYTLDGTLMETNIEGVAIENNKYNENATYEPYTFVLGTENIIEGLKEGITYMNEGATAQFVIPSKLAYPGSYRSLFYIIYLLKVGSDIPN